MEEIMSAAQEAAPETDALKETLSAFMARVEQKITDALARADAETTARETALNEREQALDRRALNTLCEEALSARGLPVCLSAALSFAREADVVPCVDALEQAFRQAVQQGVEDRLKGQTPKTGYAPDPRELPDEEYYAAVLTH